MPIPADGIYDIVVIDKGAKTKSPGINLFNGTEPVGYVRLDKSLDAYDPSHPDFQAVHQAIHSGSVQVIYSFKQTYPGGEYYNLEDLPAYLNEIHDTNPFFQSHLSTAIESETEPHNELWFKKAVALDGLRPTFPNLQHTTVQSAYTAFEADGWSRAIIDAATVAANEAIYEMRLLRMRVPVHNDVGALLRYDLAFVGLDITSRQRQFSADKMSWHPQAEAGDVWFAEYEEPGVWQEHLLNPTVYTLPAGTTKSVGADQVWAATGPFTIRNISLKIWSLDKIKEIIVYAKYYANWSALSDPIGVGVIRFSPKILNLITPLEQKQMVDAQAYTANKGWLFQISKVDSSMKQGVLRGVAPTRNTHNCGIVSLVSNPVLNVVKAHEGTNRRVVYLDNVLGITTGTFLYWGDEICFFDNVTDGVDAYILDTEGNIYQEVTLSRAQLGTTMLTPEEELTNPIYGTVNGMQVQNLAFTRMENSEYPCNLRAELTVDA